MASSSMASSVGSSMTSSSIASSVGSSMASSTAASIVGATSSTCAATSVAAAFTVSAFSVAASSTVPEQATRTKAMIRKMSKDKTFLFDIFFSSKEILISRYLLLPFLAINTYEVVIFKHFFIFGKFFLDSITSFLERD
jgi:hypothetical protein